MFEKLKKFFKGFEYVCDVDTIFEYMEKELEFCYETNLEAVVDFHIYYKDNKYHVIIWNYGASDFKDEAAKGLSVTLDDKEFNSIDNFKREAMLGDDLLAGIKENLKIELTYSDSTFLNDYQKKHLVTE